MALQKAIQSESGVTTEYWKIKNIQIEYSYTSYVKIFILVDGYLNEQLRNSNYQPATVKSFIIDDPETWTVMCGTDGKNDFSNNPFKVSYEWIKANVTEFANAVDV